MTASDKVAKALDAVEALEQARMALEEAHKYWRWKKSGQLPSCGSLSDASMGHVIEAALACISVLKGRK